MTQNEFTRRMAEIDARPVKTMTLEEEASLAAAEAMDDGTSVTLEELKEQLSPYSGRIVLRIPRSLHKSLKEATQLEEVSLNQYILYKLSL